MKEQIIAEMNSYIQTCPQQDGDEYQIYEERKAAMKIAKRIVEKYL